MTHATTASREIAGVSAARAAPPSNSWTRFLGTGRADVRAWRYTRRHARRRRFEMRRALALAVCLCLPAASAVRADEPFGLALSGEPAETFLKAARVVKT